MVRFGKISKMVNAFIAQVQGLGGITQNKMVSPKGLYSKPVNSDSLVLNLSSGGNQDVTLPLQVPIQLGEGDICLTDNKSRITLKYSEGGITITTKNIKFDCDRFVVNSDSFVVNSGGFIVNSDNVALQSPIVTSAGKLIGATHVHIQSPGGGSTPTLPPL